VVARIRERDAFLGLELPHPIDDETDRIGVHFEQHYRTLRIRFCAAPRHPASPRQVIVWPAPRGSLRSTTDPAALPAQPASTARNLHRLGAIPPDPPAPH